MKKTLFNIILTILIFVGFSGQSWAFGWLGHHHGGQGNSSQGSPSSTGNTGSGSNTEINPLNQNSGAGGNSNPGTGSYVPGSGPVTPQNNNFPAAPVPEPMTLSLLGTGLAGILLKRKIR